METLKVDYKSIPILRNLFEKEEQRTEPLKFYRVIMNKEMNGDYNIKTTRSSVRYTTKKTWLGKTKVVKEEVKQELSVGVYAMKEGNSIYEITTGKRIVVPALDTKWDDGCIYCYGLQEINSKDKMRKMIKDRKLIKSLSDFDFKTYKFNVENMSVDVTTYVSKEKISAELAESIMRKQENNEETGFQYIKKSSIPKNA